MCFRSGEARTSPMVIESALQIGIAQILARDDVHQRMAHQFGGAQLALRGAAAVPVRALCVSSYCAV